MSKKFWNFIRNEAGERELRIDGVICDNNSIWTWFDPDAETPKKFREELNSDKGDITVWINSEGGDVFAATEIYNMLKEYPGKVTVKIDALAASAASVISMAGDTIEISPVGLMMIHNPLSWAEGDAREMLATAKILDEIKATIINAYELKTKLPREQLAQMMDDETWIHAQKAIELGFADKILYTEERKAERETANFSTRRQVMNLMTKAIKAKQSAEPKAPTKNRIKTAQRKARLNSYLGGIKK